MKRVICGDETANPNKVCDNCKAIMIDMNLGVDDFKI
jgi:hypothetical protein